MTLHFFCVQNLKKKKKKKKDRPADPPDFQLKKANKPFIFLGLISVKYKGRHATLIKVLRIRSSEIPKSTKTK